MQWNHFKAMGTTVSVLGSRSATAAVCSLFAGYEQRLSRFRPGSELSRINDSPAPAIEVSETMAAVLKVAASARERTGGLVDPAVASRVHAWGYDRTFFDVVDLSAEPQESEHDRPGRWHVTANVLHRDPGVVLDLGGIAKGWAADAAMALTDAWAVNAGGDLRSRHPGLDVEVRDPWGGVAATVHVGVGGLATSSTARRSWRVAGRRAHHLVDPRTGRPAIASTIQATATAASAAEAEAAAKAMILHDGRGLAWASDVEWVRHGLAVWSDGSIYATRGLEVAA